MSDKRKPGRPRLYDELAVSLTVRVDPDTLAAVRRYATRYRVSVSQAADTLLSSGLHVAALRDIERVARGK